MRCRGEWIPAVAAPVLVAASLLWWRRIEPVFVGYHLGLCLVWPWLAARRSTASWREHLLSLGLGRRGLVPGTALGVVFAAAPLAAFAVLPEIFPTPDRLRLVLDGWHLDPHHPGPALLFLALINGPAEEMFWRGWLPLRLGTGRITLIALAVLFTSYHAVTIGALAPHAAGRSLMLASVLLAAIFWTWTRQRWGTLWPALLTHSGATLGYLAVCRIILQGANASS